MGHRISVPLSKSTIYPGSHLSRVYCTPNESSCIADQTLLKNYRMTILNLRSCWPWTCFNQSGLSLCRMDLKFSAHTYFMMRNSNLNSVSTENQHEILNKFGKCLLRVFCFDTLIHSQMTKSNLIKELSNDNARNSIKVRLIFKGRLFFDVIANFSAYFWFGLFSTDGLFSRKYGIPFTLRAETFADRNLCFFRVFCPFLRKFLPLKI